MSEIVYGYRVFTSNGVPDPRFDKYRLCYDPETRIAYWTVNGMYMPSTGRFKLHQETIDRHLREGTYYHLDTRMNVPAGL